MYKFLISICILLFFVGCQKDSVIEDQPPVLEHPEPQDAVTEANRDFAIALFQETSRQEAVNKNVILAPISVSTALSMVLNGSDGQTRDDMVKTLGFEGLSLEQLNSVQQSVAETLQRNSPGLFADLSNAIFWDPLRIQPASSFLDVNSQFYNPFFSELDFGDPNAVPTINSWVEDQTEGRIRKILDQIDPLEIMFLINTLYLKADWSSAFPEEQTLLSAFTLPDGTTLSQDFMMQRSMLSYSANETFQAVEMMLGDSTMSMTFIIPHEGEDIHTWIDDLSTSTLDELYGLLQPSDIRLYLPKFELGYYKGLKDILSELGMGVAFNMQKADFSRLGSSYGNIYLSRVEHKTYLRIDENGVEGAAVTSVGVGTTSEPPSIWFDRPFVFLIRDLDSETILFIGKVVNPQEEPQ